MKKLYNIILTILSIGVLSWVLPWLYSLCFPVNDPDPFVSWSPVSDSFIVSMPAGNDNQEPEIFAYDGKTGMAGNHYSRDQRDSLLPEIYTNQLATKGLMPDSLKGIEMSMQNIRRNRWIFTSSPRDINRSIPKVYPLMESMPARFDLEDPKVVMMLPGHVEIINMETNSIDTLKTERFATMFAEKGFKFPVKEAIAHVTTRKAYDNGYLLIDADNNLYHLKMQVGRPSMARIPLPDGVVPTHVFITENADRVHYGIFSGSDGGLYVIERDDYRIVKLPEVNFDPERQRMSIIKGLFSWVIKISDEDGSHWVALDSQNHYNYLGEYSYSAAPSLQESIAGWIFPFTTNFSASTDQHVYPRIGDFSWHAIFLNIVLAAIAIIVLRRQSAKRRIAGGILTLIFGIFSFIPLLLIKH